MRRLRRITTWTAGVILALVLVLALGAAALGVWLARSLPQTAGEVRAAGLAGRVEILRDRNGVVHIRAAAQRDAYFALGFAHAQDRLWQMDLYRRIGAGRLAEVVGKPGLAVDRVVRTLGVYRLAEAEYAELAEGPRAALEAYVAGVNAEIAAHRGPWPPEFTLLAYRPEPWRPADSLVLGKLLALMLGGNWFGELQRAALAEAFDADQLAVLLPLEPPDAPLRLTRRLPPPLDARRMLAAVPPVLRPRRASNAWAVAGRHTQSGKPILANDPHLGLTAPAIWYLARLEAPGLTITGATVPGVPFHLLGHNGSVAWGLTTTYGDTADLFVETLADGGERYVTPGGPAPFTVREEHIAVRFGRDVTLRVRETRHGPVVSDVLDSAAAAAGHVMALASTALAPGDRTATAIYNMNRAHDAAGFAKALRDFHAPQQNVFFADTAGAIGFVAAARVPVRASGRGLVPAEGADGAADWTGFIPFESLPQVADPPAGQLFNANNRIVGPDYPYFISADWDLPYRAERIGELLARPGPMTVERSAAMQTDTVSAMARDLLPILLATIKTAGPLERRRAALATLRAWGGRMDRGAAAPLIFSAWTRALSRRLFADELGNLFAGYWSQRPAAVKLVLGGHPVWCDDVTTAPVEDCAASVTAALDDALAELAADYGGDAAAWRWGDAHRVRFLHPLFSFVPGLARWLGLETPTDGGPFTLKRGGIRIGGGRAPYANNHGAGYRAVYDLADLDNSLYAMAPGQSGNPYSRLFADRVAGWRDGAYFRIPSSRDEAAKDAVGVLTLVPAGP